MYDENTPKITVKIIGRFFLNLFLSLNIIEYDKNKTPY